MQTQSLWLHVYKAGVCSYKKPITWEAHHRDHGLLCSWRPCSVLPASFGRTTCSHTHNWTLTGALMKPQQTRTARSLPRTGEGSDGKLTVGSERRGDCQKILPISDSKPRGMLGPGPKLSVSSGWATCSQSQERQDFLGGTVKSICVIQFDRQRNVERRQRLLWKDQGHLRWLGIKNIYIF